eukprot:7218616-Pyramimonas_sp.AAC.1
MVGAPASMAATAEFVVPRSMPTTFSPGATSRRGAIASIVQAMPVSPLAWPPGRLTSPDRGGLST